MESGLRVDTDTTTTIVVGGVFGVVILILVVRTADGLNIAGDASTACACYTLLMCLAASGNAGGVSGSYGVAR